MLQKSKLIHQVDIRPLGFLLSILLSLLWYSYQQPLNIDSITYLKIANTILHHGMNAGFHQYSWPFFPAVIAFLSKMTGFTLHQSGAVINTLLLALIITAFVSIIKTLGGSKKVQLVALFVILFYPKLSNERALIIRDFGYYAFILMSLNALLLFQMSRKLRHLVYWGVSTLFAMFFRIEGFVFFLLAPLITLMWEELTLVDRIKLLLKFYLFHIVFGLFVGLLVLFLYATHLFTLSHYSHLRGLISADFIVVFSRIKMTFLNDMLILKSHLLEIFAKKNAALILVGGIAMIFIANVAVAITPGYLILSFYGFKRNSLRLSKNSQRTLIGFLLINSIILLGFISQHLFATIRYCMFLSIILLLPIAPAIVDIYERCRDKVSWRRPHLYLLMILGLVALSYGVASTIHIGASMKHIIKAGRWVNQNTPLDSKIYVNDLRLIYYSNRAAPPVLASKGGTVLIANGDIFYKVDFSRYNYLLIRARAKDVETDIQRLSEKGLKPIKIFRNNRRDAVIIVNVAAKHVGWAEHSEAQQKYAGFMLGFAGSANLHLINVPISFANTIFSRTLSQTV